MTFGRPTPAEQRKRRTAERRRNMKALATPSRSLHRGEYGGTTSGAPVAKENALQHTGYMAAVRALGYCMLCRRSCQPQFCHADMGKGERIKTDVRRGWPGCGPGDWGNGCHWLVGTSGQYEKAARRALEAELAKRTRAAVLAAGTWPKTLPQWPGGRMNCKPGDIAVVVRSVIPENVGGMVRVLDAEDCHEGQWRCESMSSLTNSIGIALPPGSIVYAWDSRLRPIRDPGDDARDETLTWLPVPSKEHTCAS